MNKESARRSVLVTKKNMQTEYIEEAIHLMKLGYSYNRVEREFKSKGYCDSKGKPFKKDVIRRRVLENQSLLNGLDNETEPTIIKGSFEDWFNKHITKIENDQKLTFKSLALNYFGWCDRNGFDKIGKNKISQILKSKGESSERDDSGIYFTGLNLHRRARNA